MPCLIVSDLHLTARPLDEYRWGLFPWLMSKKPTDLLILGDLTDLKDKHPAPLVHRIVAVFKELKRAGIRTYVLKGNHDYIDADIPFFGFLQELGVNYIGSPRYYEGFADTFANVWFLPHTRNPEDDWKPEYFDADYTFIHQTVAGCVVANGSTLHSGVPVSYFDDCNSVVYSGDIHIPQMVGRVTYIGTPYPIRHGDNYRPRCLQLDLRSGSIKNHRYGSIRKPHLFIRAGKDIRKQDVGEGDQVRVTLELRREELIDKATHVDTIRKYLKKIGAIDCGIEVRVPKRVRVASPNQVGQVQASTLSDAEVFKRFCNQERLDSDLADVGRDILCNSEG